MKKRTVAVIGLGVFGRHLITKLKELNAEVIAADVDKDKASLVGDIADRTFILDGSDANAIINAGIDQVETAIVAMGQGSPSSLVATIATTLALKKAGIQNIIVRMDDESNRELLMEIGATGLFSPLKMASEKLANLVLADKYEDYFNINEEYSVLEIEVKEDIEEINLVDLNATKKYGVIIILIQRDGKHFMPTAESFIKGGDRIFVFGKNEQASKLASRFAK